MPSPGVLWRTVRHLKPRQVLHQVKRRLGVRPFPHPLPMRWRPLEPRVHREKNTSRTYLGDGVFTFNNETRPFSGDWNEAGARKLWLYNLHYMTWLFDVQGDGAFQEREAWVSRWAEDNPPSIGTGWEPYPLSLRIFNWCKHYTLARAKPREDVRALLEVQAGNLLANLEFHLDGNHLLENLLALAFAGLHLDPDSRRSRRALERIGRLLHEELDAQFLEDGGHYELSPMYHAILLERLLDLLNVWPEREDPFSGLREKIHATALKALDWLDVMSVNGRFSLFNDSCYDGAPEAGMLMEYGARLLAWRPAAPAPLRELAASGYYRADTGPFTLIFDAGKLGPDHQLGHAQGDMLSFCLWLRGIPVLTHPGNFEYLAGEMRDYCRSTAAHNTLEIAGAEQAEWWAAHRVGWRGHPCDVSTGRDGGGIFLEAAHNGYIRLPGRPLHRRALELSASTLIVRDCLTVDPGRGACAWFHVHPECNVERAGDAFIIRSAGAALRISSNAPLRLGEGWYCPEFGMRLRGQAVIVEADTECCTTFTFIEGAVP